MGIGFHSSRSTLVAVGVLAGLVGSGVVASGLACSNNSSGSCAYRPAIYQVFQPPPPTASIPLCGDNGLPPTHSLSDAGLTQCQTICQQDLNGASSCCFSQWEPQTILCPGCKP
jgi:hypothetical protein